MCSNTDRKVFVTSEEILAGPDTFLKFVIFDHLSYPIGLPLPSQLPLKAIIPEEREAVIQYYTQGRINHWSEELIEEICPIYQAPEHFLQYIEKCCIDLTEANERIKIVDHWLYPGFYVKEGHVVAAIMMGIPSQLTQYPWPYLLALNITGYELDNFPKEICTLKNLKYLDVSHSKIHSFPPEIANLTSLQALSLDTNSLIGLPDEICHLHSLNYLNLNNNCLETLPADFGELHTLRALHLYNNHLRILPDSFGKLHNLEFVDLSMNFLIELPSSTAKCESLKLILLDNNRLSEYPTMLSDSTYIVCCNGNIIRSLYGIPPKRYHEINALLTSTAQGMLGEKRYNELSVYYSRSVLEIATSLVNSDQITIQETERLIHEATFAIRQYLEINLLANHPVLIALAERWTVNLISKTTNFQILL